MKKTLLCVVSIVVGLSLSPALSPIFAQETPDTVVADETLTDESLSNEESALTNESEEAVEEESTEEESAKTHSIKDLFLQGGDFMWPILIIAALGVAFILERFIYFATHKTGSREFIDSLEKTIAHQPLEDAEKLCEENDNILAKVMLRGLRLKDLGYERVEKDLSVAGSVEVAMMERRLNIIAAVGSIAPTLGFLGTVVGMIAAFNDIAAADQVSAKIVAGGIRQALLTTAAGLIAAIPALLFYNYFITKIEAFASNVERLSTDLIEKLLKNEQKKLRGEG